MIKISYRAHDYGKGSAYDVAKKVASHKLTAVQLVINKCIEGESGLAGTLNPEKCKAIYKGFADNGKKYLYLVLILIQFILIKIR
jgi:hypothetical protein